MADYRYLLCDAPTGQLLEELPLDVSSFGQQINGVGTLTGTLALGDIDPAVGWRQATTPRRTLLIVLRDNIVAWGGLVMKRRAVKDSAASEIGAETIEGYLGRRRVKTDLTITSQDLFAIVREIIDTIQAVTPGGNLRITYPSTLSGQTTSVTYLAKDRHKALDSINALAQLTPGFEYSVTWNRTGNVFTPGLAFVAPYLSFGADPVLLEFPGTLAAPVDDPEDGADAPNALTGIGADAAGSPLMYEAVDSGGELAGGYPIFEDEVSLKEETDFGRLQTRTTTALQAKLNDHVVPQVELRAPEQDTDLQFGDFPLGVGVRVRCTCPFHPANADGSPGLDVSTRRVTGWTVVPGPPEKVTLNLGAVTGLITPPRRDRDVAAYLRDVNRRLLTLETNT